MLAVSTSSTAQPDRVHNNSSHKVHTEPYAQVQPQHTQAQLNVSNTLREALTFGHLCVLGRGRATGGQALLTVLLVRAARTPLLS
eukprot:scaffold54083_cov14-Tisochrysis_lutea.AAC.1